MKHFITTIYIKPSYTISFVCEGGGYLAYYTWGTDATHDMIAKKGIVLQEALFYFCNN